jgi:hypothetical protein
MTGRPRELLKRLFEYIGEQLKDVDPRGFQLQKHAGFLRGPESISGLPGVNLDLREEGDHVWLQVYRLEASLPPKLADFQRGLFRVGSDPFGAQPTLDESGLQQRVSKLAEGRPEDKRPQIESEIRVSAERALKTYVDLWKAWAEGEKPRRSTISLYGDLFALKHQMEAEETAKPTELVWGIGVAVWRMSFEGAPFSFNYPILTQAVEITLDEKTMSLAVRPRATIPLLRWTASSPVM